MEQQESAVSKYRELIKSKGLKYVKRSVKMLCCPAKIMPLLGPFTLKLVCTNNNSHNYGYDLHTLVLRPPFYKTP